MTPGNLLQSFHYPPVNDRMVQLGFYMTSIGSLHYPPNTSYPLAGHPDSYKFDWDKGRILHDYVLILIEKGGGVFESTKIPLSSVKAGQAIYLVPGEWHRYRPHLSTGWSERWICLNGFHLHQLRKSAIISDGSQLLIPSHMETTVSLLERLLLDAKAAPTTNEPAWSARALEIMLQVCEDTRLRREPYSNASSSDPLVDQAVCYIRENCHRPLTVNLIAACCHTGRRTLERHFASTGINSVAQAILRCRMERAELLLKESHLPIKQIAFSCGFVTPQRMIYSFRHHYGCTPGSLRGK